MIRTGLANGFKTAAALSCARRQSRSLELVHGPSRPVVAHQASWLPGPLGPSSPTARLPRSSTPPGRWRPERPPPGTELNCNALGAGLRGGGPEAELNRSNWRPSLVADAEVATGRAGAQLTYLAPNKAGADRAGPLAVRIELLGPARPGQSSETAGEPLERPHGEPHEPVRHFICISSYSSPPSHGAELDDIAPDTRRPPCC